MDLSYAVLLPNIAEVPRHFGLEPQLLRIRNPLTSVHSAPNLRLWLTTQCPGSRKRACQLLEARIVGDAFPVQKSCSPGRRHGSLVPLGTYVTVGAAGPGGGPLGVAAQGLWAAVLRPHPALSSPSRGHSAGGLQEMLMPGGQSGLNTPAWLLHLLS